MTDTTGAVAYNTPESEAQEFDPAGADAGTYAGIVWNPQPDENGAFLLPYPRMGDPSHPGVTYTDEGMPVSVDVFMNDLELRFPSLFDLFASTRVVRERWQRQGDSNRFKLVREYEHSLQVFSLLESPLKFDIKVVSKAVDDGIKMTDPKKHKQCDQALNKLSGGRITSLNALVTQYKDANGNLAHISDGRTTTIQYGTDAKDVPAFVLHTGTPNAQTYINSAFFSDIGLGSEAARAIILIHESIHQFAGIDDNFFDPKTHDQTTGSQNITRAIVQNCYPVLKALGTQLSKI